MLQQLLEHYALNMESKQMRKYKLSEKLLIVSGILLIISLPIGSALLLTISLTLFALMVTINMRLLLGKSMLTRVEDDADSVIKNSIENKKYIKACVTFIALPMIGVGILFVIIQLLVMWAQVIK